MTEKLSKCGNVLMQTRIATTYQGYHSTSTFFIQKKNKKKLTVLKLINKGDNYMLLNILV